MQFPKENWDIENYNSLVSIIQNNKGGVAAFDFDNTLVKNDFGEGVMDAILWEGLPKLSLDFEVFFKDSLKAKVVWSQRNLDTKQLRDFVWQEYKSIGEISGVEAAYRWSSFIFTNYTLNELEVLSLDFWDKQCKAEPKFAITPFVEMQNLIRFLQQNSWQVYIVTASPTVVIQSVVDSYNLPKENVFGMELALKDGKTTFELIEPFTYGQGKVKTLLSKIGKLPDLSFGDSWNDYPLLLSAQKKAMLLDKGDQKLTEECIKNSIMVQKVFR